MSAIQATSAGVRDMADGSLRITLEFDPRHAKEAYALFGARGTPCAVAALTLQASQEVARAEAIEQTSNEKPGQLCVMACTFCADPLFWRWMENQFMEGVASESKAKELLLSVCGIQSRKELDTSKRAATIFHELIRQPFLAWRQANPNDARRAA